MVGLLGVRSTAAVRLLGPTVRGLSTAQGSVLSEGTGVVAYGRVQAEAVGPALEQLVGKLEADFAQFERDVEAGPVTWEGTVERAERLRWPLERAWGAVGHLNGVKNSDQLRTQYQAMQPKVVALFTRMGQSKPLYGALRRLAERTDLDAGQRRIVDGALQEAVLAGVGLEGDGRQRFNELAVALSAASTKFANNVLDATKAFEELVHDPQVVAGLPAAVLALLADRARQKGHAGATAQDGPWLLTLDQPCFGPFMQYSTHRQTRERLYRAYITRASSLEQGGAKHNNEGLMGEILGLRREQSGLLGYSSYADMSLTRKMAKDVGQVERLLGELHTHCLPAAQGDMQQLRAYAQQHGHEGPLLHWDTAYWSERQKKEVYGVDGEQLRPYFPLPRVLDGLFALANSLFGVDIKEAGLDDGVAWHPDVRYYEVRDTATGKQIAGFFLDPCSRPQEKRGGAWMDVCLNRSKALAPPGQPARLPIAHLVCNQMPPVDGRPSLMTFYEVQTLFHEFGHGLQHMLTNVDHCDAAGISGVEWAGLTIMQFMENWCYDRDTVAAISGHVDTGRPLPDDIFERLLGARTYMAGSGMLRQLQFAAVDLALHHRLQTGQDPLALYQQLAPSYSVLPPLSEDRFLCGFSHIFAGGYAAGYYSYKWAEVLSQDAFGAFEEAGKAQYPALGRRFRETVLGLGGSMHPAQVFEAFRGRPPSTEPLLRTYGLLQAA
eukprot:comp23870_c0_seq2/m.41831 comp23870_c0_seq2/g.41831  ORF comp23870_c0_seq2/g.41831 comp23870_c0_seq2/m.41831 type:complete len:720 (-) comp23870_c0_seq2:401-2560(-)